MSIWRMIRRLFRGQEQRYDHVRIISAVDGSVLEGHDAVEAHFEKERRLEEEHGSSLIFQVYRTDMKAQTLEALHGRKLAEFKLDGGFVSGNDTAEDVKAKLLPILQQESKVSIGEQEKLTLFFNGRTMQDDTLFYAGNFILLPAWVQVLVHEDDITHVMRRVSELQEDDPQETGSLRMESGQQHETPQPDAH